MWSSRSISSALVVGATLRLATVAAAQDPAACEGVLGDSDRAAVVLSQVPKYGATYVLVFPDRIAERLAAPAALAEEGLRVGVYSRSEGAAMALPGAVEYDFARDGVGKAIEELLAGNLEAAVLWAPLAGLGILELDDFATQGLRLVPTTPSGDFNGAVLMGSFPFDFDLEVAYVELEIGL